MKKLLTLMFICLFIMSCNISSEPSQKQQEFAQGLVGQSGIIKTEWSNNLSLRVTVELSAMGINPKMQAQLLADEIASIGFKYSGDSICASIYYGNLNKLASSCLYKQRK